MGRWIPAGSHLLVNPGAFLASATSSSLTLAPGFTWNAVSDGNLAASYWKLPASQAYNIQTTLGSNEAIVSGTGVGVIAPGTIIWSDAFLFGTTVWNSDNRVSATPAPTVNSGGSGYVGTSGTMTYSSGNAGNNECVNDGYSRPVVLNVTASGGVITGVTGIADAGECLRGNIPATATGWVAGGGLSGGSGASFNLTFIQDLQLSALQLEQIPKAKKAYSAGSPGKMWRFLPAWLGMQEARCVMPKSLDLALAID